LFVWIEGADDLTPEAQAFLRRILETVSEPVQCILECRDQQKITPAIQSRCLWRHVPNRQSFRKTAQLAQVASLLPTVQTPAATCADAFMAAEQPIDRVKEFLTSDTQWEDALLSLREIGAGSSPWAHLYSLRAAVAEQSVQSQNS
jgi:hypothetical protein